MALPPIPAPLPPWARALLWISETLATGVIWQQFDHGAEFAPTQGEAGDPLAGTWRRFVWEWEDLVSLEPADTQMFSIDLANITGGQLDGSWTDADYTTVFNQLQTYTTQVALQTASRYKCTAIKAYIKAFNPYPVSSDPGDPFRKPFAPTGPPERIHVPNALGSGSATMPPQVCTTVTEITPSRAHWGRFYTPTIGATAITSSGRLLASAAQALATNTAVTYEALQQAEFFPVVPVTQSNKIPLRALQVVNAVQVDDVIDVQRRRRLKIPLLKVLNPTLLEVPPEGTVD